MMLRLPIALVALGLLANPHAAAADEPPSLDTALAACAVEAGDAWCRVHARWVRDGSAIAELDVRCERGDDERFRACIAPQFAAPPPGAFDDPTADIVEVEAATGEAVIIRERIVVDEDGREVAANSRFDLEGFWDAPAARADGPPAEHAPSEPDASAHADAFQAALDAALPAAHACYRDVFPDGGPSGRITVRLSVRADGVVDDAALAGRVLDDVVAACVVREARALRLPASSGGADLFWPVTFDTHDDGPVGSDLDRAGRR